MSPDRRTDRQRPRKWPLIGIPFSYNILIVHSILRSSSKHNLPAPLHYRKWRAPPVRAESNRLILNVVTKHTHCCIATRFRSKGGYRK
ncbi:hypothetical protein FTS13_22690 [Salmonella enterica subsp. enterica]|nr:hypothetical protein [Salmonella enterica subsp. enterica serovar Enteritidis]